MTASVALDIDTFFKRLQRIRGMWKQSPAAGHNAGEGDIHQCDAIMMTLGNPSDMTVYQKTTAMFTWLLGYEFPETVMIISRDHVTFVTSVRKGAILDPLASKDSSIKVLKREKELGKNGDLFQEAWNGLRGESERVKLGILTKDKNEGPMIEEWLEFCDKQNPERIDVSFDLGKLMGAKDDDEIQILRVAAKATSVMVANHLSKKILTFVDEGKKVKHSAIADEMESFVLNNVGRLKSNLPAGTNLEFLDICYPPIIQSGSGRYSLKPSAMSDDENLSSKGFIICSMGLRYKSYCANMARTLLIDGNKDLEGLISFARDLQIYLASQLIPGTTLSSVHAKGLTFVRQNRPELEKHLVANFGFGIGLEFRMPEFIINSKCDRKVEKNMAFNLFVGLQDLEDSSAVMLCDTVVTSDGVDKPAVFITNGLDSIADVSFSIKSQSRSLAPADGRSIIKTRHQSQPTQKDESSEKRRREHQRELGQLRIKEAMERYAGDEQSHEESKKTKVQKFESYRKDTLMPKDLGASGSLKIFVDKRAETVILPINGIAVPFHINTVKNVTKNDEGDFSFIRINFNSPGRNFGKKDAGPIFEDLMAHFIRGITFRTADPLHAQEVVKGILDMKKSATEREFAKKERADLVEQGALNEVSGRRPIRLADVYVRPGPEGKRLPGDVEIHSNGLRWRSQIKADQRIDVLYSNVKHLFFQPCDNETIVLIHMHLHHPIIVGKKKTKDLQFYREALDSTVDETSGRRQKFRYGDEDEIAQEQEERRRKAEANNEFKTFAEKIVDASKNTLEIDVPFRDLGFNGVPGRQTVTVQPTTDCLVHLVEMPFLIVTLNEIEVAFLERVVFGLKNFDLVFVYKDHNLAPVHITSIPVTQLEPVKEWLDSVDAYFVESKVNFNWTNIMKTVNEDPSGFYEMGGWTYLQPDGANPEESDEAGSSEYEPDEEDEEEEFDEGSEDNDEEGEDSDEDEDEDEEEYEDSDEDEATGSDEEDEAPDWDELEEAARQADNRRLDPKKRPEPETKRSIPATRSKRR